MLYVIVCRPQDQSVLVQGCNQLPTITYSGDVAHFPAEVCNLVREKLNCNLEMNFLRLECWSKDARWHTAALFEVLNENKAEGISHCKWVAQAGVESISVDPPSQLLTAFLRKYKVHGMAVNGERLHPYSRAGWFERASMWIKENLKDGEDNVETIEKHQHGIGSCVLRIRKNSGLLFYMKCSERMGWWNEIRVTWALGQVMSKEFQQPIAVDFDLGWMLTRNYGTTLPDFHFETDLDAAKQVLCCWAEIQKRSIPKVQELQEHGVPKVDGKALKAAVDRVMDDPVWFKAQREGMNEPQLRRHYDESEYKWEYRAYLHRLFKKVEGYNVPLALVNGDVEPVNTIMSENQKCTFIDMFHTQISFPFMDVTSFPIICGSRLSLSDFDLDFYLKHWTEFESMERLRELLLLVDEVASVESVISCFLRYETAEEHEREQYYRELKFPVCRNFSYHMD
ncbi:hypothetical protein FGB62_140g031 [Gracilaria domingensis]|nr:hypothetical protein FGB62_140g031 [Gracilaria domingensis]